MVGPGPKDKSGALPIVPGLAIKDGAIAGRYRIEKLLGAGSSGFVVAARHVYLRKQVTLKILTSTTNTHQRVQRRHLAIAHQAAALRGPHVARIVDTGFTEDGTPFVATERLAGRTFAEELALRGKLPAAEAVHWILQACEGLAEAHAAGIVHGDLKPQNLFLAGDAPTPAGSAAETGVDARILKVLDFGMASPVDEGEDEGTSAWFASPAYLSPEQIRDPRAVDARTDVWALGVILHQAISGSLPFASETISGMLVAVAYDEPALLAGQDVPFELARAVQTCLAKQPEARHADVAALARALSPFAGTEGLAAANRAAATLSTPPPMAMSTSIDAVEAAVDAREAKVMALARPRTRDVRAATARRMEPSLDEAAYEAAAFRRRRLGALAMAGVASLLAVAGLLAPTRSMEGSAASAAPAAPAAGQQERTGLVGDALPVTEGTAVPLIVPSLALGADESAAALDASASPPATPSSPAPAPTPVAPPRRSDPVTMPAGRTATRDLPPAVNKPHSSLAVREDPYVKGFTHPTRLSERRK